MRTLFLALLLVASSAQAGLYNPVSQTFTTGQITATQNLSTATPTQMTSMSVTPVAGSYTVDFDCSVQTGTGGNSIVVYVYIVTTTTGESRQVQFPTATLIDSGYPQYLGIHMNGVVVNGAQAINIFWSTSASAAQQSTVLNRRLSARSF